MCMNWLNLSLAIVLILIGFILLVYGIIKKSKIVQFFGIISIISPSLCYLGWFFILPLVPIISMIFIHSNRDGTNTK